ncbi:prepilin-type N-terminal cleavage/methylation domain-containing protein [bacterium]|nr:prepilin-type N-terminal cleavage/methylation domain-containing protein [bacterium]
MKQRQRNISGFTFIEVMVSILIFSLAGIAAASIVNGSVRATRESKEISEATWLLQNFMSESETKLEAQGIEKACQEKETGKFDPPYDKYTWTRYCTEIDYQLSETASKLAEQAKSGKDDDDDMSESENQLLKVLLTMAGDFITRSMRELHVEINWQSGKNPRQVTGTSHFVRYDQQPTLPQVTQ